MIKNNISICIVTYKRVQLLKELLHSLSKLSIPDGFGIEIIIVDNDKDRTAENVVQKFKEISKFKIKYFLQPIKNISLARNTALQNAKGELIAFIDDDETADEKWLHYLNNCLKKFNADGVFGFVVPRFEEDIDERLKKREYYFSDMGETGSEARYMFTGSVLFKSELIKKSNFYFDPGYGITGGEDADFFNRLKSIGANFINCREAISYEFISKYRTSNKFFLTRNIRGGQTYIRNKLKTVNKFDFITKLFLLIKSLLKSLYGLVLFGLGFFSFDKKIKGLILLGSGLGETLAVFSIYKKVHKN